MVSEVFALWRVKPRHFDFSALVFLAAITACMTSKAVLLVFKSLSQDGQEHGIQVPELDVFNMCTELIFWILLNFFVLEMLAVQDYIEARGSQDFERRLQWTWKLRKVMLPL